METIKELEDHLKNYRDKKAGFPTYEQLVDLTKGGMITVAEAKDREAKIIAGFKHVLLKSVRFAQKNPDATVELKDDKAAFYEHIGLEEFE